MVDHLVVAALADAEAVEAAHSITLLALQTAQAGTQAAIVQTQVQIAIIRRTQQIQTLIQKSITLAATAQTIAIQIIFTTRRLTEEVAL